MSHRIIIGSSLKALFSEPDVQAAAASVLNPNQCARVESICADPGEPSDEDFRFLTRKLNQLYTSDD